MKIIISAVLLLLTGWIFAKFKYYKGTVMWVYDGDTIKIRSQKGKDYVIRLEAIDAPEKDQPYAKESKDYLFKLCFKKQVTVKKKSIDKYGRIVGRVKIVGSKIDIPVELIKSGMAWHYKYFDKSWKLSKLEKKAKKKKLGLWSQKEPKEPWDYRRENK